MKKIYIAPSVHAPMSCQHNILQTSSMRFGGAEVESAEDIGFTKGVSFSDDDSDDIWDDIWDEEY